MRRVYEPCARYASYRAFAESPLLLGAVAQLLGSDDLMCHYSKVNMKPPQVDTIVDWQCATLYPPASTPCPPMRHCTLTPCVRMRRCPPCSQDLSYYPLTNKSSVAVLLYLDDADEQNGALRVVPRDWNAPDVLLDHASYDGASLLRTSSFPPAMLLRQTMMLFGTGTAAIQGPSKGGSPPWAHRTARTAPRTRSC